LYTKYTETANNINKRKSISEVQNIAQATNIRSEFIRSCVPNYIFSTSYISLTNVKWLLTQLSDLRG